jgi:hypothetical protein
VTPALTGLAQEIVGPDEAAVTAEFIAFLKEASRRRDPTGPIRRFNQGRAAGCVEAEFEIPEQLPEALRVGLFSRPETYRAHIRFANASSATDREKDVRGMAIALFDVPGKNLIEGSSRQDFVLNSHPVMVASDSKQFLALLQAMEQGGLARLAFFARHPALARIGLAAQQHPTCHLDIPYWSTTPYLFGDGRAVKYVVKPCSSRTSTLPARLTDTYLTDALATHLAGTDAAFDFMVQFQVDSVRTPIEDATVEWHEQDAPYVAVAKIRIRQQRVEDPARADACERFAFNPWHCLVEHRPLGNLNRARREIYRELSQFRERTL